MNVKEYTLNTFLKHKVRCNCDVCKAFKILYSGWVVIQYKKYVRGLNDLERHA